jgi:SNF2 family DNA or RNA helicase
MDGERQWVHVAAGDAMREILKGLRDPGQLDAIERCDGLQGTLRPYQRDGLAWLRLLTRLRLGACLADDMGLGKTIQVLALLLCNRASEPTRQRKPSLLVVPASLLGNWRAEARHFAPSLKLTFLHPAEEERKTLDHDVCDVGAPGMADAGELAAGDSRRGPGDQEPVHAPEQGREETARGSADRTDRHAGGEPPWRPVVAVRFP